MITRSSIMDFVYIPNSLIDARLTASSHVFKEKAVLQSDWTATIVAEGTSR